MSSQGNPTTPDKPTTPDIAEFEASLVGESVRERLTRIQEFVATSLGRIQPESGLRLSQQALGLARALGEDEATAKALNASGAFYLQLADDSMAAKSFVAALRVYDSLGDTRGQARLLQNLALVQQNSNPQKARSYARRAIEMAAQQPDPKEDARYFNTMGSILVKLEDWEGACTWFEKCREAAAQVENRSLVATAASNYAAARSQLGHPDTGEYLARALDSAREAQMPRLTSCALINLGQFEYDSDNLDQAESHIQEALRITSEMGSRDHELGALRILAKILEHRDDLKGALELRNQIEKMQQDLGAQESARTIAELSSRYELERSKSRFRQLSADIAEQMLKTHWSAMPQTLELTLENLGVHYNLDRVEIWWFRKQFWERDQAWGLGENVPIESVLRSDVAHADAAILRGEVVSLPETDRAAPLLGAQDSVLLLPLVVNTDQRGCVLLSTIASEEWLTSEINEIQTILDVIATGINRANAESEVHSIQERLAAENLHLREEIRQNQYPREIVGEHGGLRAAIRGAEQVAPTDATVLIVGETGAGKELIARRVQELSRRRNGPFITTNCAAIAQTLSESELFGHERGAFTGASSKKLGKFELADGGTLFLDEIGELPLSLQSKLLRVLQEGQLQRVGSTKTIEVDVRIIAATNRDLQHAIKAGEFREDLYYRLNVFPITVPPLRERPQDIPELVRHFVEKHSKRLGCSAKEVSEQTLEKLKRRSWPGNVRELENWVERTLIGIHEEASDPPREEPPLASESHTGRIALQTIAEAEHNHIRIVLDATNWRIGGDRGAAKVLGIPASTLRSRMQKLGIERPSDS